MAHHPSKKIIPNLQPVVPPREKVVTPKAPIKAFGKVNPFVLESSSARGPRMEGFVCVAGWRVVHDFDEAFAFEEFAEQLGNVRTLFHGTPHHSIQPIMDEGLQPGKRGMFGAGIYTGPFTKAFNYARGYDARYVLQVRAILGRSLQAPESRNYTQGKLFAEGYHSVHGVAHWTKSWGGTLNQDEFVLYNPAQVIVDYIYEYQETERRLKAPTSGVCVMLVEAPPAVMPKKSSAFKDILSKRACGAISYTHIMTDAGQVWVCANCITRERIRMGSRIRIYSSIGKHSYKDVRVIAKS